MGQPLGRMDNGCQSPQDQLLLANRSGRLCRVCEEMHKMFGVRSPTPPKAESTT